MNGTLHPNLELICDFRPSKFSHYPSRPATRSFCHYPTRSRPEVKNHYLSVSGPATATAEERSGVLPPELTFFSSKLLSHGQRIACGTSFSCRLCQTSHIPVTRSQTVLVTGSELLGAAGLPNIMGLPSSAKVEIPKVSPAQCWDSLVLLGGLGSDPFKIIQAI